MERTAQGAGPPAPPALLRTKLFQPAAPRRLVPRPRLTARLEQGTAAGLLLVSAPAGFGKTTALAAWLAARPPGPVAWVSLDGGDREPATFWAYVVAALDGALPGVVDQARALLQAGQPVPTVLTTLVNELADLTVDAVLVLDDLHLVEGSAGVLEHLALLLAHRPPRLHLVLATRADPALPLARLRARGELVEVRAADLRFTPDEALAYLNGAMGLQLTTGDVAVLEARTEGWIAALQLAALSLQGRDDAPGFIAGFAGDARYVVDYLVEEVLARQPAAVQDFLLRTSVLDRLTGPVCDAVTGQGGGRAVLEALDRANLFLVPLDDTRSWYRYHHLFADVLRARLRDEQPDLLPLLHERAADWYDQHGEPALAVGHALAGGDVERAADLVELAAPVTGPTRQEAVLRRWLEALPPAQVRARPVLADRYAGALMATGEFAGVEAWLSEAERWLEAAGPDGPRPPGMVVSDEAGWRELPTMVAVHRAGLALVHGDPAAAQAHADRALVVAGPDHHLGRAAAAALSGLARWGSGDLAAARAGYATSLVSMQRAGHLGDVLGLAIALADILAVQGRLTEAMRTYDQALQVAAAPGGPVLRGTADMHVGRAGLHLEQGDRPAAAALLARAEALGEHLGLPQHPYRRRLVAARLRAAEGDLPAALALLDEAVRVYEGDFSPDVRPVASVRARLLVRQGRLREARAWVRARELSDDGALSYLHEHEHVTLARLLLAEHRAGDARAGQQAAALLDRLLAAAEAGDRGGTVLELLVLQGLVHADRGDTAAGVDVLRRALAQAEPETYVQLLLDEGPPITALLTAVAAGGAGAAYARRLLGREPVVPAPRAEERVQPRVEPLVEPLSARELDVLRLLAGELTGPDIARELVLSLNTVRTHTRNIYAKLGVGTRRAAVRRAGELDLLRRRR